MCVKKPSLKWSRRGLGIPLAKTFAILGETADNRWHTLLHVNSHDGDLFSNSNSLQFQRVTGTRRGDCGWNVWNLVLASARKYKILNSRLFGATLGNNLRLVVSGKSSVPPINPFGGRE